MFNLVQHRKPSKKEAVISILIVFFILGFPMIAIRDMVPHIPILLALICLIVYGRARGISFDKMQDSMAESVHTSMGAIYLFFFIGILVTALMISGAIPSLIYFGLNIISSKTFYLSSFLATAIIGIAIGSSLTIMTTRPTGGLHKGYKPKGYRPASKGAGFHSVQARPLTRRHPLKGICTTCHP